MGAIAASQHLVKKGWGRRIAQQSHVGLHIALQSHRQSQNLLIYKL